MNSLRKISATYFFALDGEVQHDDIALMFYSPSVLVQEGAVLDLQRLRFCRFQQAARQVVSGVLC